MKPMGVIRVDGRKKPASFNEVFGKTAQTIACVDTVRANEDFNRIQEQMSKPLFPIR